MQLFFVNFSKALLISFQVHLYDGLYESISENATTLHSYMGVGNSKIMTTVYRFTVGYMNTYITVADDGCIPMVMESSGQDALGGK